MCYNPSMIVAVTGPSGHVGANLVRALLKRGRQVRVLVHKDQRALEGLNVEIIQGDVGDPYALARIVTGAEVVYHLAAIISLSMNDWPAVEKVNVLGTRNVVEACLKFNVRRMIHFSSIHAMTQEPFDQPLDEKRSLMESEDCPPYDRSKAAGEREVREGIEQGLDAVILNPTSVIGPDDYQLSHMGAALLAMARGKLPALIEGGFDWVDVRDVVAGALAAEEKAPQAAKYMLSGHFATVCDLAKITEDLLGVPAPRFVCPTWLARTGAPVVTAFNQITRNRPLFTDVSLRALNHCNHDISHERATRELNYSPRPLRDTLRDTFGWFEKAGLLEHSPASKKKK
jgi:dihydroflavonol-4-reductase